MPISDYENVLKETRKIWSLAPVTFETLVDYGQDVSFHGIVLDNQTNAELAFKIGNSEFTVPPARWLVLDEFKHRGILQWKYSSVAPTEGNLTVKSW